MPTNDPIHGSDPNPIEAGNHSGHDSEHPGYETTDVNINGVIVFLAALSGFLLIFFVFSFAMGKVINNALQTSDGPVTKWNKLSLFAGAAATGGKRQDLANNPEMEQKALEQITAAFPSPRLDTDDGEQGIADMHAREDLLLDHYSSSPNQPGVIRIPVEEAMRLIVKRGLPLAPQVATEKELAEDHHPPVQAPLTTGFARTGYELDVMEARAQKLGYEKAEGSQAEPESGK